MFGRNNSPQTTTPSPTPVVQNSSEQDGEKQQATTVISSEVRFDGNLIASGHVYIHGQVNGNIVCNEGFVKIARNSTVVGNITCDQLIIDGSVNGECKSTSIDIHEHGHVDGTVTYVTLSVKKGGVFSGKAEVLKKQKAEVNVISMAPTTEVKKTAGSTTTVEEKKEATQKVYNGKQKN